VASYFIDGVEGWSALGYDANADTNGYTSRCNSYSVHLSRFGFPDGCLRRPDDTCGAMFFQAAAVFLGDQSAVYGGTLEYTLKLEQVPLYVRLADVVMRSANGTTLVYKSGFVPTESQDWKRVVVPLEASAWHRDRVSEAPPTEAEMRAVLTSLRAIHIRGEYFDGGDEAYLDNVLLRSVR